MVLFRCLEDDPNGRARVRLETVYPVDITDKGLKGDELASGVEITVSQCGSENIVPFEKGSFYAATLEGFYCRAHDAREWKTVQAVYSTQYDASGSSATTWLSSSVSAIREARKRRSMSFQTAARMV